ECVAGALTREEPRVLARWPVDRMREVSTRAAEAEDREKAGTRSRGHRAQRPRFHCAILVPVSCSGRPMLAPFTATKVGAYAITRHFHSAMRSALTVSPKL